MLTSENQPVTPSLRGAGWLSLVGFITTIPVANVTLKHFGFWRVPILGPVASGVIWVGLAFVLRDVTQLILGKRWAIGAIAVGSVLSWFLAAPRLAVASGVAFAVSEVMDAAIYTPLADRMFLRAVIVSGWAGSFIDSTIFVRLAFGSYRGWWQLGLVKAAIVAAATPGAYAVRRRLASGPAAARR